jgi:hypothetical protein
MGVHPVRAGDRRVIIGAGLTLRDRRRLRPGKAVLPPGWQLAVPVYKGGCTRLINKIDVKALAWRERNARVSVRPDEAEYSSRFAVDGKSSGARSQAKPGGVGFGRGSGRLFRQKGDRAGDGYAGREDLPAG